jgi:hypothetical protein
MAELEEADDFSRRRRENDERDLDDRPPRRSGGLSVVAIGLIVGGVLLLLACVIVVPLLLLIPAVSKVREAASRTQEQNNLKILSLAMHNDNDAHGGMFAPYAHDKDGKIHSGLSFRVSLLPYLEQDALYRSFDLAEAWDSPRNAAQSAMVVKTFQSVVDPQGTNTPYRVFVGGGALFNEDGKPVKLVEIQDGTANTILFVYASDAVPWAKPQELKYGKSIPLPKFGHPSMTTVPVAFADGSVRMMRPNESEQTIRALIEKGDGQVVNLDW